jgi:hypothetical protein
VEFVLVEGEPDAEPEIVGAEEFEEVWLVFVGSFFEVSEVSVFSLSLDPDVGSPSSLS